MTGSYLVPMQLPHLDAALRDLHSATAEVRWVAAMALARESGARRLEAIAGLERLSGDAVEEVRAQAIEGLAEQGRSGHAVVADRIRNALGDGSDLVRSSAIQALAEIAEDPLADLSALAGDPSAAVRAQVARLFGELRAEREIPRLAVMLDDADDVVRQEAALALATLGDGRGQELLIELLGGSENEALEAAWALGQLGSRGAVPALTTSTRGWLTAPPVKAMAAAALVRCGSTLGLEVLSGMLGGVRRTTRMAVLGALSRLPVTGIAGAVVARIDHGNTMEASSAISTVEALTAVDPRAVGELKLRRGKLGGEIERELAEALAGIGMED